MPLFGVTTDLQRGLGLGRSTQGTGEPWWMLLKTTIRTPAPFPKENTITLTKLKNNEKPWLISTAFHHTAET